MSLWRWLCLLCTFLLVFASSCYECAKLSIHLLHHGESSNKKAIGKTEHFTHSCAIFPTKERTKSGLSLEMGIWLSSRMRVTSVGTSCTIIDYGNTTLGWVSTDHLGSFGKLLFCLVHEGSCFLLKMKHHRCFTHFSVLHIFCPSMSSYDFWHWDFGWLD